MWTTATKKRQDQTIIDDDILTEEDKKNFEIGRQQISQGEYQSLDEVEHDLLLREWSMMLT